MSPSLKNKYVTFMQHKQEQQSNSSGQTSGKYLNYYNPNKELNEKGTCFCRVLPNKNTGEMFFYEGKKHRFKVGATTKMAFCLYSTNPKTGDRIADKCPFCDFLEENHESLSDDTNKVFNAKEFSTMLVYNYMHDEVQKYEVNYYGIMDIMPLITKLIEDEIDIDAEGFDLIFKKDKSGYAKAVDAVKPKISLEELFANSNNVKEIPDIYNEVIPTLSDKFISSINATFQYALKAFAPTFVGSSINTPNNDGVEGAENNVDDIGTSYNSYDPNAVEENETKEEKPVEKPVEKKSVEKPHINTDVEDDGENNEMLEDLQDFVNSMKKNKH
jgi:hypothetical protein